MAVRIKTSEQEEQHSVEELGRFSCLIRLNLSAKEASLIPMHFDVMADDSRSGAVNDCMVVPGTEAAPVQMSITPIHEPWARKQEWLVETPALSKGFRVRTLSLQNNKKFRDECREHDLNLPYLTPEKWQMFLNEMLNCTGNKVIHPTYVLQPRRVHVPWTKETIRFSQKKSAGEYVFQIDRPVSALEFFLDNENFKSVRAGLVELFFLGRGADGAREADIDVVLRRSGWK